MMKKKMAMEMEGEEAQLTVKKHALIAGVNLIARIVRVHVLDARVATGLENVLLVVAVEAVQLQAARAKIARNSAIRAGANLIEKEDVLEDVLHA